MPENRISDLPPSKLRLMVSLLLLRLSDLVDAEAQMEEERSIDALLVLRDKARAAREYLATVRRAGIN